MNDHGSGGSACDDWVPRATPDEMETAINGRGAEHGVIDQSRPDMCIDVVIARLSVCSGGRNCAQNNVRRRLDPCQ